MTNTTSTQNQTATANGQASQVPKQPSTFHLTDLGNAKRLVHYFGHNLRFVHDWNVFLVWDGTRWKRDERKEIRRAGEQTIMRIHAEVPNVGDSEARKKLSKHAFDSESERAINAMLNLAKHQKPITATSKDFDNHDYLLTVNNGTIDLKTGKLLVHDRGHMITRKLDVDYLPGAPCLLWLAFLDRIMASNQDMISYLQKAIGYSLTGDVSEQCMFFPYGVGANGKSTLIEVNHRLMGDYAYKIPAESLMVKTFGSGIPNDIAQLPGRRFVVTSEVPTGRRLSESLVKDLTGGDTLTARFMRAEYFNFRPTHKLWMYGNHEPKIYGRDDGIWRRIRKIPFGVTIPKAEQDKHLLDKLLGELPGILNWAVQGCLEWQKSGLQPPDIVTQATNNYRKAMDKEQRFIDECCVICDVDPFDVTQSKYRAKASELNNEYKQWCEDNGEKPNLTVFRSKLDQIGCEHKRLNTGWHWFGIGLLTP